MTEYLECEEDNMIPEDHIALFTGVAIMCHEVIGSYCAAIREDHTPWTELTAQARDHIVGRVAFIVLNPDAEANANHDVWMFKMLSNGWKHAKVKDTVEKKHPSLVPFHHLPTEQQAKDHIFNEIVRQIIKN